MFLTFQFVLPMKWKNVKLEIQVLLMAVADHLKSSLAISSKLLDKIALKALYCLC